MTDQNATNAAHLTASGEKDVSDLRPKPSCCTDVSSAGPQTVQQKDTEIGEPPYLVIKPR